MSSLPFKCSQPLVDLNSYNFLVPLQNRGTRWSSHRWGLVDKYRSKCCRGVLKGLIKSKSRKIVAQADVKRDVHYSGVPCQSWCFLSLWPSDANVLGSNMVISRLHVFFVLNIHILSWNWMWTDILHLHSHANETEAGMASCGMHAWHCGSIEWPLPLNRLSSKRWSLQDRSSPRRERCVFGLKWRETTTC